MKMAFVFVVFGPFLGIGICLLAVSWAMRQQGREEALDPSKRTRLIKIYKLLVVCAKYYGWFFLFFALVLWIINSII